MRTADFAALVAMIGVSYWLIYRRLASNAKTAGIAALSCAGMTGYWVMSNLIVQNWFLVSVESIRFDALLYVAAGLLSGSHAVNRLARSQRATPPAQIDLAATRMAATSRKRGRLFQEARKLLLSASGFLGFILGIPASCGQA